LFNTQKLVFVCTSFFFDTICKANVPIISNYLVPQPMQKPLVFEIEDLGWGGCHLAF